jgi:polysaccharide biosynthesis/export protein
MRYLWLCTALIAFAATGCETFGFSTPTSPLTEEAEQFRKVVPVAPRELAKEFLPSYVIEPGDTLLVQTAEFDSPVRLPPDQPVLQDGTIDLGLYGRPVVGGRTLPEIEPHIHQLVNTRERERARQAAIDNKEKEPEYKPVNLTVRLIGRASKVYYVLGEVNVPNAYPLSGRETVLDGIVQAGGLNKKAARNKIILSRPSPSGGCRVVMPVCYDNIVQLGDTTTNYQLQPGDRVFVPSMGMFESLIPAFCKRREGPCVGCQVPCSGSACPAPVAPPVPQMHIPQAPTPPALNPPRAVSPRPGE